MRHFPKEKDLKKIQIFSSKKNVLRFLSLRYSADCRRSRLVRLIKKRKTKVILSSISA